MYLEHFGLNEPPFRITPVTVFFFSGANRGEILDALIYSLSEGEGIIKVSGEVGSGKTMLCRMLLERLPEYFETIYLANPSLSRKEMLYAIADALGLKIDGERVGVIMHGIQSKLEEKAREGKRVVVLVDEAHAMPLDTLEELRLLYNLQSGNAKLLQIILFGQQELNAKLDQPNMRQLKDRIVHHFDMQPLSRNILENYLMFRMRAAGYRGPSVFSPGAIKLIADASNGLLRRANILADKSLLAAFVEDTHNIEARHVEAAMRDCEIKPSRTVFGKKLVIGGSVVAVLLSGLAAWWMLDRPQAVGKGQKAEDKYAVSALPDNVPRNLPGTGGPGASAGVNDRAELAAGNAPVAAPSAPIAAQPVPTVVSPAPTATPTAPAVAPSASMASVSPTINKSSLFEQRLAAGKQLIEQTASTSSGQAKAVASIQLFYNNEIQKGRIEGFLRRAEGLGKLSEIYLLPAKFDGKDGLRIVYGAYPSVDAARNAVKELPKRYQEAFATSIYTF
ncbi:MAG: AAA family ATPase [Nitrosomonadales bacterium]|nr:AAA family ATPase [Nitrosomonadales bacterium]